MPCYKPLTGWKPPGGGQLVFSEHKLKGNGLQVTIPCGRCIGCKLERSRQWAVRCMHETRFHAENSSITLTYDDEHLPAGGTLVPKHWQDFMKRLREDERSKTGRTGVRFYMGGEYGETNPLTGIQDGGLYRPHYHAIIFGIDWHDKKFYQKNDQGDPLYTSERLERIWGMGQCKTGAASFLSAGYIARYCTKKITGDKADEHYNGRHPEFSLMSNRPGIGAKYIDKYADEVYNWDEVIINGKACKPPKYYDKLHERTNPDRHDEVKAERELRAYEKRDDNTPERLEVKRQVTEAAIRHLKRKL